MPPSSLVLTPKDKSEYIYKCIKLCINHTTATLPDAIKSKASGKKSTQQTKPYQKVRESENLVKKQTVQQRQTESTRPSPAFLIPVQTVVLWIPGHHSKSSFQPLGYTNPCVSKPSSQICSLSSHLLQEPFN